MLNLGSKLRGAAAARATMVLAVAAVAAVSLPADSRAAACGKGEIRTADGCTAFADARREVKAIVAQTVREDDLRAVLLRVDIGRRTLVTASPGESMQGVPATMGMNFRIGSIAIPFVVDLLLQLDERGRLSLDDPISRWFPDLPNADRVTLRMLASATSGYPDWVQGNEEFQRALFDNPFRQWSTQELLDAAFSQNVVCEPGACFRYAHTGYALIGKVIRKVTGRQVEGLLRERVLDPLRLRHTRISGLPGIPEPVFHAYMAARPFGADNPVYEDTTYWSPSWGLPRSMLMTATIADVIKASRALGTGALVSKASQRARLEPITASLPSIPDLGFTSNYYFGLGAAVLNGWVLQNPSINGYASIGGYLPDRRISFAVTSSLGPEAARTGANYSFQLFGDISRYLTPGHPAVRPG